MDKSKQPDIKVVGIYLVDAVFHLREKISSGELNGEYQVEVRFGYAMSEPGKLDSLLEVLLKNRLHPDVVEFSVKIVGKFEGEEEAIKAFAPNSATVMLPYARQIISGISSWAPMNTLFVPLMNVTASGLKVIAKEEGPIRSECKAEETKSAP